ncbi:RNA polymerase sigma factor [Dactylosporangium sp. CS-033363]|uniref:RNA polymerase sigma factor n=1 Tax=Dactylosporangium sp. CS-033363 TaxID=3239935 RepID=UPI003D8BD26E
MRRSRVVQYVTVPGTLREAGRLAGHDDARRDFFAANYARLAGWVRRQVDDDETAHDIAAEAFTRLLSRWSDSYDPHAYLYKVAVNLLRDHWRRAQRERRALGLIASDDRGGPDGRPERGGDLRAMLEPLPEHQRTALLLHYLAGFSVREVAAIVGRPEGTVKSDLFHAKARIRAGLDGIDD